MSATATGLGHLGAMELAGAITSRQVSSQEVIDAARAGHSVRVLLTIYAHCVPGHEQIASQRIEQALRAPDPGPQLAHNNPHDPGAFRPSCVRATAGLSRTQLDLIPPARTGEMSVTCANADRGGRLHGSRPRTGGSGHPLRASR